MTNTDLTWSRDTANDFTLWTAEGDWICEIVRSYDQRPCASGFAAEVNDTTKPMRWDIVRPGQPTRRLGTPGLSVRAAKKLAESICCA
jgi:hypothetical protein